MSEELSKKKGSFEFVRFLDLIANMIDFLIITLIVFVLYKQISKFKLVEDKTKS